MESSYDRDGTDLADEAILAYQSSFNRVFRRWTGYAPGEVRRQGGG